MSLTHAVVLIGHDDAHVLKFDEEHVQAQRVKARSHHTKQHGNAVRTEHEFHAHVCDAIDDMAEVLVAGSKTSNAEFKHYVEKHRPQTARRIVHYETVSHPTDNQLVAMARQYFLKYDQTGHKGPQD